MSKHQEMKEAKRWMYENASAAAKWSAQTLADLTTSSAFYTQEQLYAALEDSLPLLTPEKTGIAGITPVPEGKTARQMIVAHTAAAVMENSVSRLFETVQGQEKRFTTDELLLAEQTIFREAAAMAKTPCAGQPFDRLDEIKSAVDLMVYVVDEATRYAYDQPVEYTRIFNDFLKPGNLRIANGPPGSGKSMLAQGLLFAIAKDAVENGKTVPNFYASAPSEKAAADIVSDMNVMQHFTHKVGKMTGNPLIQQIGAAMPEVYGAPSLDDMIGDLRSGKITKGDVVVIDEAGLMGAKQSAALLSAANVRGVRLFMMGDNLQIPPKTAGNGFDQMLQNQKELGLDVCDLKVVLRQKTKGEAGWTIDIRQGDALKALKGYAARRYTGFEINQDGRMKVKHQDGVQSGDPGLQALQDKESVYDRLSADFIKYRQEYPNGTYVVMGTDDASAADLNAHMRRQMVEAGLITQSRNFGTAEKPFEIGNGDTIMLHKPVKMALSDQSGEKEIQAGSQLLVTKITGNSFVVQTGDLVCNCFAKDLVENGGYGLALPLYQAQGQSKDRAFLAIDKANRMDKVYGGVAFSRHLEQMSAYVSKEAYPTIESLAAEMSVFRTRQTLLSDAKGTALLDEKPRHTEENVAAALKKGYTPDAVVKQNPLNTHLVRELTLRREGK